MSALIPKYVPFEVACRLRSLQQGSLNVGNTKANIANLLALCLADANGAQAFTKWRVQRAAGTNPTTYLRVCPQLVPGYVPPPLTYGYGVNSLPVVVSMTAGASGAGFSFAGATDPGGSGTWTGYAGPASNIPFGSLSGSPNILGNTIAAIMEANGAALILVLPGALAQTLFTRLQYTDSAGAQSWLTASATFSNSAIPGFSRWEWLSGANGKFTNGNVYALTFS